MPHKSPSAAPLPTRSRLRRGVYAGAGVVLVGIGAVGVFVPGLPTTIWLMAASFLFARSSPKLEARLIRNRFFGPYLVYLDRPAHMPRRAKVSATALMCGSASISTGLLAAGDQLGWGLGLGIPAAALAGTWFVWNFGRSRLAAGDSGFGPLQVCADAAGERAAAAQAA